MNKRSRRLDEDDKSGPSKVQLRGLTWNAKAAQPAFLRNALSALSGPKPPRPEFDENCRPSIPERPLAENIGEKARDEDGVGELSDDDEWDMGRGEEAPAVVVLKEGKHLERDEVDKLRAESKSSSGLDPLASSGKPQKGAKASGSLNFSTASGKSNALSSGKDDRSASETWEQVVERSNTERKAKELSTEIRRTEASKAIKTTEKQKKKEKKSNEKKISMLSFDED